MTERRCGKQDSGSCWTHLDGLRYLRAIPLIRIDSRELEGMEGPLHFLTGWCSCGTSIVAEGSEWLEAMFVLGQRVLEHQR